MSSNSPSISPAKPTIPPLVQMIAGLALAAFVAYKFPGVARNAIAFIIVLGILVFVHEWGHFQFARWAGMKVNRFALGFPPFVFNKEKNGVVYSIGALPIGGMVDIAGLGSEEEMVNTAKGEIASPVRDTKRPFGQKQFQDASLGWRFLTLFAGPLMNFIFAILVAIALFSVWGRPDETTAKFNRVGNYLAGSPAEKAGLQVDDLIVGVNGQKTDAADKISAGIRNSKTDTITLDILRNGEPKTLTLRPELSSASDAKGKATRMIGIQFAYDPQTITYKRMSVPDAISLAVTGSWNMVKQLSAFVARAFTFRLTSEDKQGVGGPLAIAKAAGQSAKDGGIYGSLELMIALSINLGLLNLLPFPALDGGRICFLGYELVMRRPIPARIEGVIHAAGMVMLLSFMLFITLRDIVNFTGKGRQFEATPKGTPAVNATPQATSTLKATPQTP